MRLFCQCEGFIESALLRRDGAKCTQRKRESFVDLQDPAQFFFGILEPAGVPETNGKMMTVEKIERILVNGLGHRGDGVDGPAERQEVMVPVPQTNVT